MSPSLPEARGSRPAPTNLVRWAWRCVFLEEDGASSPTPQESSKMVFVSLNSVADRPSKRRRPFRPISAALDILFESVAKCLDQRAPRRPFPLGAYRAAAEDLQSVDLAAGVVLGEPRPERVFDYVAPRVGQHRSNDFLELRFLEAEAVRAGDVPPPDGFDVLQRPRRRVVLHDVPLARRARDDVAHPLSLSVWGSPFETFALAALHRAFFLRVRRVQRARGGAAGSF